MQCILRRQRMMHTPSEALRMLLPTINRPYESVSEKQFMEELFPNSLQPKIILQDPLPHNQLVSAHRALGSLRLVEKVASIYALLQCGDVDAAEVLFYRCWRGSRVETSKILKSDMINKFISVLLRCEYDLYKGILVKGSYGGYESRAMDWFNNMLLEYNCERNLNTYALFVYYFMKMAQVGKVKEMVVRMEEEGMKAFELLGDEMFSEEEDVEGLVAILKGLGFDSKGLTSDYSLVGNDLMASVMNEIPANIDGEDYENDDLVELRPTDTIGVSILRNTLKGKSDIKMMDPYNQQLWLEARASTAAQEQWQSSQLKRPETSRNTALPHDLIENWYLGLEVEIKKAIEDPTNDDNNVSHFLKLVPIPAIARLTISALLTTQTRRKDETELSQFGTLVATELVNSIGKSIEKEHNFEQMNLKRNQRKLQLQKDIHKLHTTGRMYNLVLRQAITALSREENAKMTQWKPDWGIRIPVLLGALLLEMAIKVCLIPVRAESDIANEFNQVNVPGLTHDLVWVEGKQFGVIKLHHALCDLIANSSAFVEPWSLPMLVPPLPWLHPNAGGYLQHRFGLVRSHGNDTHKDHIKAADKKAHLVTVMRSLDVLGSTPWKVNREVYKVAAHYWNADKLMPGLPSILIDEIKVGTKDYERKCRKRALDISNAFSERCSVNYKLDIARSFIDEVIYFPHNVDFRGRAYPLPPHLHHMGDDLSRGLLTFGIKKKLGVRGLYWLKIQLSNLYGFDKASLQDRVNFVEEKMDEILEIGRNPLGSAGWLKADKPWQFLACCFEMERAMLLPDPTQYESNMPVHQDGSCNGLQHYAALGGDSIGAKAVNLIGADKPDDVYMQVAKGVQKLLEKDLDTNGYAVLMNGKISRKLVKQTVMTNTYGVTKRGAQEQVLARLKEMKLMEESRGVANYIVTLIFKVMESMFTGAREIQLWLHDAATQVTQSIPVERVPQNEIEFYERLVREGLIDPVKVVQNKENSLMDAVQSDENDDFDTLEDITKIKQKPIARMTSMTWTTPLGFPVVQPYRNSSLTTVKTFMQNFTVADHSRIAPVNSAKQATAFPPNFVHSLDASHMMVTANACHAKGLVFASIHDSFWTHACDIDTMNSVLRESFIRLHQEDIMTRLKEELIARYSTHRTLLKISNISKGRMEKIRQIGLECGVVVMRRSNLHVWQRLRLRDVPKKGDFNVEEVRDSTYFFH